MNTALTTAIRNKKRVSFRYNNEFRSVEPHCYGIDSRGRESLLAYETGLGWQVFDVDTLWNIYDRDDGFEKPRPNYSLDIAPMSQIIESL